MIALVRSLKIEWEITYCIYTYMYVGDYGVSQLISVGWWLHTTNIVVALMPYRSCT